MPIERQDGGEPRSGKIQKPHFLDFSLKRRTGSATERYTIKAISLKLNEVT